MRTSFKLASTVAATMITSAVHAATFTPSFSDYAFSGGQYDVDAPANAFFNTNYGINVSNAYLYHDSRDTFDGIGIANGLAAANYLPLQSGRIDFLDTTDFVSIDYLAILNTTYDAYSASNTLLGTFSAAPGNGSFTLSGGGAFISYLTFTSDGGFGTVSGLTYNYDGITGGGNTDLPGSTVPIPEPETYAMLMAGLGIMTAVVRRRKQKAKQA